MIGIRREDRNRWERRVPLTPDHVTELVGEQGLSIKVQPSANRAFPDLDYTTSGALVDEDLRDCNVILGIKEIPPDRLVAGKAHVFFSHTTKGQACNMPLLRRLMELDCTLIDYEQIADRRGRRLIFFGRYAGYAGMIDALWTLGQRLATEGFVTPFERIRLAHDYSSLDEATHHVSRVGERIRHEGLPAALQPILCGLTGTGNVSLGAQEIFERLPTLEVAPEEVPRLLAAEDRPRRVLYKVVFGREHRFRHADGNAFDSEEFARHPERYRGGLTRWLDALTVLVHGAFWTPDQPRLVALDDLRALWRGGPPRLRVIADISCDIGGGVEANVRATSPGDPVYVYDVRRHEAIDGVEGEGPVILAVENLPCQFPAEASEHFGDMLIGVAPILDGCDWTRSLDELELPQEISRAIIVHRGRLAPRFDYLERHLA